MFRALRITSSLQTRGALRRFLSAPALSPPADPVGSSSSGGFWFALMSSSLGAAAGAAFSYAALMYQQENMVERAELQRALGALRTESASALHEVLVLFRALR